MVERVQKGACEGTTGGGEEGSQWHILVSTVVRSARLSYISLPHNVISFVPFVISCSTYIRPGILILARTGRARELSAIGIFVVVSMHRDIATSLILASHPKAPPPDPSQERYLFAAEAGETRSAEEASRYSCHSLLLLLLASSLFELKGK